MQESFSKFTAVLLSALAISTAAAELEQQFQTPPQSARPRTWWHWVSGNVSAEGITADLRAMKDIGLGGCQIFTVDQSDVKGPVKFMGAEWRGFMKQALAEADQLGLEVSIEGCDGWSESGGPWIQPEQGMQHVVWTERHVTGSRKVPLDLPQPEATKEFYRDVAVLAFPMLRGDDLPAPVSLKCNLPSVDGSKLIDGDPSTGSQVKLAAKQPLTLEIAFDQLVSARSLIIRGPLKNMGGTGDLETSVDGVTYAKVGKIALRGTSVFPEATAKFFRLNFSEIRTREFPLSEIRLGGERINQLDASIGMAPRLENPFAAVRQQAAEAIDPAKIVDLTGKKEWAAPPGRWTIVRFGHTGTGATTHPSTTPGLECDKLSPAAVRYHFEQMYGPIMADSPTQAGRGLHSILLDSWECGCANWTALMPQEFSQRRGYDLKRWLPVFTGRVVQDADTTQRFLWDFRRTIADLLTEIHYGGAQEFARKHGMKVYAEAPGIGLPTVADNLACKGRTDVPMGEFWINHSLDANTADVKEAASAGHIYGKPVIGAEAFTATAENGSWANDPYSLKLLGDYEFCLGINRFIFHRYAHQPWNNRVPGMSMGPWGINFERSNTWWQDGTAWIDYISRCQHLLQQGRFVADALYFYGEGATAALVLRNLKPELPAGYDYDVCNAEILLQHASVERGEIVLQSGMRYRVLILPDTDRMTLPLLKKIGALVRAGAVVCGPKPAKSPSLTDADRAVQKLAAEIWGDCDGEKITSHNYGKGRVFWGEPLAGALPAAPDFRAAQPEMRFIHRRDGGTEIYFVSSQQKTNRTVECSFRVTGKIPELWHPDTGRRETLAMFRENDGVTTVPITFDPAGSVFVVFRQNSSGVDSVVGVMRDGAPLFTGGSNSAGLPTLAAAGVQLPVREAGDYVLKFASGKTAKAAASALPAPLAIEGEWRLNFPPKLGAPATATFDRLMSWTDSADDGVKYFSGTATYEKEFELPAEYLQAGRELTLDLGGVKNLAQITFNGKPLEILWKEPFRVNVTRAAKPGKNKLSIRVTNLWPNRLIGDQKLPEAQRITWASVQPYKASSPLLPSGLLGPVMIVPEQVLRFDAAK